MQVPACCLACSSLDRFPDPLCMGTPMGLPQEVCLLPCLHQPRMWLLAGTRIARSSTHSLPRTTESHPFDHVNALQVKLLFIGKPLSTVISDLHFTGCLARKTYFHFSIKATHFLNCRPHFSIFKVKICQTPTETSFYQCL